MRRIGLGEVNANHTAGGDRGDRKRDLSPHSASGGWLAIAMGSDAQVVIREVDGARATIPELDELSRPWRSLTNNNTGGLNRIGPSGIGEREVVGRRRRWRGAAARAVDAARCRPPAVGKAPVPSGMRANA